LTRVKSDRPRFEYTDAVSNSFCPGARFLRQPKPQIIPCPSCGEEVEIWSDEIRGFCRNCGRTVLKDAAASCLDWCEHARECVGAGTYDTYMKNRAVSLRQKLMRELVERLGRHHEAVRRTREVLDLATDILAEEGADWHIVIPACILRESGPEKDEARAELLRHGLSLEDVEEICGIIDRLRRPDGRESPNFRVVHDADALVRLGSDAGTRSREELKRLIAGEILTAAGRAIGRRTLLT